MRQYVKVGEKARLLVAVGRKESNPVGITGLPSKQSGHVVKLFDSGSTERSWGCAKREGKSG